MSVTGDETTAGWLASLSVLLRIPPEFRAETISRAQALEMLRCGDRLLDVLLDAGLPYAGDRGDEFFDRHDLVNLALYSGSGTSVPEETMRYALRWMHQPPETLFQPKRWTFAITLSAPPGHDCPPERRWTIARPKPEITGGWLEALDLTEGGRVEDKDLAADGGSEFGVTATIVTSGEHREIRSPRLREILSEYAPGEYRWGRLPEPMQWQTDLVLDQRYAPCISACTSLAAKCEAAGFPARTRRGWIVGMLDLAHSWLEVVDDDGVVKNVDPAFAILAHDHAEAAHPGFHQAVHGSLLNRLLPTDHLAVEPVLGHRCAGVDTAPQAKTMIQLAPDQDFRERTPQ